MPKNPPQTLPHTHTHNPIVCEASVDVNQDSCERLQGNSPQMVEGEKLQSAVWLLKNTGRRRRRRRGSERHHVFFFFLLLVLLSARNKRNTDVQYLGFFFFFLHKISFKTFFFDTHPVKIKNFCRINVFDLNHMLQ